MKIARLFDHVDPVTGPSFAAEHRRLEAAESEQVLDYLDAGELVLFTTARMFDAVTGSAEEVVPLSFRTDGNWIWSEATTYYLREYGLAPDEQLLDAIHANDFRVPPVDSATLEQAVAVLQQPDEDDPVVWTRE